MVDRRSRPARARTVAVRDGVNDEGADAIPAAALGGTSFNVANDSESEF